MFPEYLSYEGTCKSYQVFQAIVSLGNTCAAESVCFDDICPSHQVLLQRDSPVNAEF